MEVGFGHDFSQVLVHTDPVIGASAGLMGALAYTVGCDIVFAPGAYAPSTSEGRGLLAHELAHVVQQVGEGPSARTSPGRRAPELEAEANMAAADAGAGRRRRIRHRADHGVQCKLGPQKLPVPTGEYTIELTPGNPVMLGGQSIGFNPDPSGPYAHVDLSFRPFPSGPKTDEITFVQAAQEWHPGIGVLPWGPTHRGQEAVDRLRTGRSLDLIHVVAPGDTLRRVAIAHYGTAIKAAELATWNAGVPGVSANVDALLTPGEQLVIPAAIEEGYSIDIDPTVTKPGDPLASPDYPHLKMRPGSTTTQAFGLSLASSTLVRAVGANPANGTPVAAEMEDSPGGGRLPARFTFQTSAHAGDTGVWYGAVRWGFDYEPFPGANRPRITNEFAEAAENPSDTFRAALIRFHSLYRPLEPSPWGNAG